MANKTLFGKYEVIKIVGQGGMGKVYLVRDIELDSFCAIKHILFKNRNKNVLLKEAILLNKLNHPGIVKVRETYETTDSIYIVMDYVEGKSLKDILKTEGALPESLVVKIAIELADILEYLHNYEPHPIIYRDVKPSNIILKKDKSIVLVDFGIATELVYGKVYTSPVALTRGYCAPEQFLKKTFDNRSDIYSLGITIFTLITAVNPQDKEFNIVPIRTLKKDVTAELEFIILKATDKDPNKRYQNIEELKYDLLNIELVNKKLKRLFKVHIKTYIAIALVYIICIFLIMFGLNIINTSIKTTSRILVTEGLTYIKEGEYKNAQNSFLKSINLNTELLSAYKGLFEYYYKTAKYNAGISYIKINQEALDKVPNLKPIYEQYLGKYYYKLGSFREASNYFKNVTKTQPENLDNLFYLIICMIQTGEDYTNNLEELEKRNIPVYKLDYINGTIYLKEKNYTKAISAFERIINIAENTQDNEDILVGAYLNKAYIYANNQEDLKLYFKTLEQASKTFNNKNVEIISIKAKSYAEYSSKTTNKEDQISSLNFALNNYNDLINIGLDEVDNFIKMSELYKNLARVSQEIAYYDSSIKFLKDAIAKYPNDFLPYYYITVMQFEKEFFKDKKDRDFKTAYASFEKAKKQATNEKDLNSITNLEQHIIKNVPSK